MKNKIYLSNLLKSNTLSPIKKEQKVAVVCVKSTSNDDHCCLICLSPFDILLTKHLSSGSRKQTSTCSWHGQCTQHRSSGRWHQASECPTDSCSTNGHTQVLTSPIRMTQVTSHSSQRFNILLLLLSVTGF